MSFGSPRESETVRDIEIGDIGRGLVRRGATVMVLASRRASELSAMEGRERERDRNWVGSSLTNLMRFNARSKPV